MILGRTPPIAVVGRPGTSTGRGRNRLPSTRSPVTPLYDQPSGSPHSPWRIARLSSSRSARSLIGGNGRPSWRCSSSFQPAPTPNSIRPPRHLVDGRHDLGEVAGMAERHRRDQDPEPDPRRVPRETGEDGPRIGCPSAGRPGEALVMVGPEERFEPGRLGAPNDRQLVVIGEALLGLDHQRETHLRFPPSDSRCSMLTR